MKNKLIIDSNNLGYISAYAYDGLTTDDHPTAVSYGFLLGLLDRANDIQADEIYFCWDSRKSLRRLIYPEYKMNRLISKDPEEVKLKKIIFNQFKEVRKIILPELGFKNIFRFTGYEADDIIAELVKDDYENNIFILSSDEDLYQLIRSKVVMFNPKTKKAWTEKAFTKKYGIKPAQWATVKMIAGCGTDNVKGIEKVGEKTAIKYLNNELPERYKTFKAIESKEGEKIINRNSSLVKLPFRGNPPLKVKVKKQPRLKLDDFVNLFDRYKFYSFLQKKALKKWKETFNLK